MGWEIIAGIGATLLTTFIIWSVNTSRDRVRLKASLSITETIDLLYFKLTVVCKSHRKAKIRKIYITRKIGSITVSSAEGTETTGKAEAMKFNFLPLKKIKMSDGIELERDDAEEFIMPADQSPLLDFATSNPKDISIEAELMDRTRIKLVGGDHVQRALKIAGERTEKRRKKKADSIKNPE